MKSAKGWMDILIAFGGEHINSPPALRSLLDSTSSYAFCGPCSKTKSGIPIAIPKEFYVSDRLLRFYRWCEENEQPYGILSDKYGIHWMDEGLKYYDIHPSQLTESEFMRLGKEIGRKCREKGVEILIFQNTSPLMSRPYFKMLFHSKVKFYYITKLYSLKKGLGI